MINRAILIGRLTKDVEMRETQNGKAVVSFNLAVKRNNTQEGQPDTDFISCVAWNRVAELMNQYLHKGSLIGIEGRIQTRNYEDRNGNKVYVTEVVAENVQFLESKNQTGEYQTPQKPMAYNQRVDAYNDIEEDAVGGMNEVNRQIQNQNEYEYDVPLDISSDDLPF